MGINYIHNYTTRKVFKIPSLLMKEFNRFLRMIIYNADMMINIAIKHDTIDNAIITDDFLSSGFLLKIDLNNFDKTN